MRSPSSRVRLFLNILAAIAVAEMVVILLLPVVAPGAAGPAAALFGATMLAILAGPVILWRMRAAVRKFECSLHTEVIATGWRLKLGGGHGAGLGVGRLGRGCWEDAPARPR